MIQLDSTEARKFAVHLEGYEGLGGELVQNGDFSQLGADVVDNGGFDELGTDVITNGSFTGELVTNGNFATDLSGWTSSTYQWLSFNEVNRSSVGTGDRFSQHIPTEIGEQYDVSVFVNSYDLSPSIQTDVSYKTINSTGLITQRITAVSISTEVWIWAVNAQINFSSFSVVKVGESPSDGWTAGTSWVFGKDKAISTQALGGELVSNGDFSATGTDLITNGDFSATGTDLVTNGDFSVGVDEIVDGDFPFPNTAWTLDTGVTVPSAGVLDFDGTSGAYAYQDILTSGNSYKVTIEVATASLTDTLIVFLGAANNIHGSVVAAPTTLVLYGVAGGLDDKFYVGSWEGTITSVSVEELGEDWTEEGSDPDSVSFGENGLTIVQSSDLGINNRVYQLNITEDSKQYKVTYIIHSVSLTSGNTVQYYDGNSYTDLPEQGVGTHTFYYTREGTNDIWIFNLYAPTNSATDFVTISSIVVQELGEDWNVTMSDGSATTSLKYVEFVEAGARFVSDVTAAPYLYLDQSTLSSGKLYKFTCNVAYTDVGSIKVSVGAGGFITLAEGLNTIYSSAPTTSTLLRFIRASEDVDCIISNVTVKELGEDWTLPTGWSVGDGVVEAASVGAAPISQVVSGFTAGSTYKVKFEVTAVTQGYVRVYAYVGASGTFSNIFVSPTLQTGEYEVDFEFGGTNKTLRFYGSVGASPFAGSITNISVEEIATSYLTQGVSLSAKTWKLIYSVSDYIAGSVSATDYGTAITANEVGITEYVEIGAVSDFRMVNIDGYFEGAVTGISAQLVDPNGYWTVGSNWSIEEDKATYTPSGFSNLLQVPGLEVGKTYKLTVTVIGTGVDICRFYFGSSSDTAYLLQNGENTIIGVAEADKITFRNLQQSAFSITNVSVEQLDPNDYWTLGTGWSIGTDKAISTVTGSNSDITQSILTAGKTYRTVFEVVDYTAGTVQAVVTGDEGIGRVAIGTYTEDLTATGADFSIRSQLGTFDGAVTRVAVDILNSGDVNLSLTNQLTEKVTNVVLTPILTNGRYTEFSYQPTDLIEGMYLLKFTGDTITYAETLAYITTGTPPLGESGYTEYTTGDDNPDHVYIP